MIARTERCSGPGKTPKVVSDFRGAVQTSGLFMARRRVSVAAAVDRQWTGAEYGEQQQAAGDGEVLLQHQGVAGLRKIEMGDSRGGQHKDRDDDRGNASLEADQD